MRYLKKLGIALLAAAALTSLASSASATTLTSPPGTTLGAGTKLTASLEGSLLTEGLINLTCPTSHMEGEVEGAGGASETVRVPLTALAFGGCDPLTVHILDPGTLEIHTRTGSADGDGLVTWSGAEITTLHHGKFIGTVHCLYSSEATQVGTLTGSSGESKTAAFDIEAFELPLTGTEPPGFCGSGALRLSGSYKFETPDYLDVD